MRTLMAVLATILVFSLCYAEEPLGDANGDCMVNLIDAIELLQGRVPCEQDCPCCTELGDMNGDGEINELDGIYLLQYLFNHAQLPVFSPSPNDSIILSTLLATRKITVSSVLVAMK